MGRGQERAADPFVSLTLSGHLLLLLLMLLALPKTWRLPNVQELLRDEISRARESEKHAATRESRSYRRARVRELTLCVFC